MDDFWGADFARKVHGLAVMSTARLALEMVVTGTLWHYAWCSCMLRNT